MRIAYLCNRYPAISTTFIQREIEGLRNLDLPIRSMSIRAPLSAHLISAANREAARSTYSVVPPRLSHLVRAHLRALTSHPWRYLRTLMFSLRLSSGGSKATVWRIFYFVESMIIWDQCRSDGIRHIRVHFANVAADVAMLCVYFADRPGDRWSWSFTLHGPVEFYDVYRAQLTEKIRRACFVVCTSDFARSQAMARTDESEWEKLRVVYCGVDPAEWRAPPQDPRTGCDRSTGSSRFRVLSVGRLIALKGHAILIHAVAELRRGDREIEVTLVGDGPDRAALEALAQRREVSDLVHFVGSVGQDSIRDYFANADAFCLPSFAEGMPLALMEAMAMELPVITTGIMGIPELVEDGVSGLLMPPARVDALAALLRSLAGDPALSRRLGRAGRAKVVAEFDTASLARQLLSLLRDYGVLSDEDFDRTAPAPVSLDKRAPSASAALSALEYQNAGPPSGSATTGR